MCSSTRNILVLTTLVIVATVVTPTSRAAGHIDSSTVVMTPQGVFNGVQYERYEAMFEGVTSNNRLYRVPCQIIAPVLHGQSSGLLLFDWLVPSTIPTAVGQEQADARYTMTDDFLFGLGHSYATVRCDATAIGKRSSTSSPSRPWSDGLLNTSTESIKSSGDEFDIVVDYVKALWTDPVALQCLGTITRRAAFGYSASGFRLRGLLRLQMGQGLFDFSLVGGTGNGFDHPGGNDVKFSNAEKAPLAGSGLEIDFQSETDVVAFGAQKARHEEANYRDYQFAGCTHIRDIDVAEFGLPDPELANPAEWTPFFRALFVAGNEWCDGVAPPLRSPATATATLLSATSEDCPWSLVHTGCQRWRSARTSTSRSPRPTTTALSLDSSECSVADTSISPAPSPATKPTSIW
jgi:Alpha/beta hydrolase domain